ncbi:MAG TPA: hypothetical protein VL426_04385 [Candidatus Binatia bacterium]|jgi:KaiC/GvpD/RAD55 family RecA-like ATPase|nr:hypothetical protein [Candidatus Binatia bacterium]
MPTPREKIARLTGDEYLLMHVFVDEVSRANVDAVLAFQEQGYEGVYVSLSKDYLSVSTALEQAGIELGRLRFVDAVSRMYGIAPVESPEVVYVDGPLSVDALIAAVASSLAGLVGEKRFVLLDSLTTLLLYNSPEATLAFNRTLKELLKKERAAGVIVVAYRDTRNKDLLRALEKDGGEIVSNDVAAA